MFIVGTAFGVVLTATATAAVKGSAVFTDVPAGAFYDDAVGELQTLGIIRGTDATHFAPNKPVTRGEVAVLLQRLRNDMRGISQVPGTPPPPVQSSVASSKKSSSSSKSSSSVSSSSSSSSSTGYNPAGTIRLTSPFYSIDENGGTIRVTVVRVGGFQGTVTVNYSMSGGSAVHGTDFTATSGTLTFSGKETSKNLLIPIIDNTRGEGNRTFTVTLSNLKGGATLASPSSTQVTIIDNETAASSSSTSGISQAPTNPNGTFMFSALVYAVNENDTSTIITVNRVGGSQGAVSVNYATSNGLGASTSDYTAANGTLSFAAGETSKTFTIGVTNNSLIEGNKTVNLTLSSPTGGAALGVTAAISALTIQDDENPVTGSGSVKFSSANFVSYRSQGFAFISIARVGSVIPFKVLFSTTGGSALPGQDYIPQANVEVNFAKGEMTKVFMVPLYINRNSLGEKALNMGLSSASNGVQIGDQAITAATIYN